MPLTFLIIIKVCLALGGLLGALSLGVCVKGNKLGLAVIALLFGAYLSIYHLLTL